MLPAKNKKGGGVKGQWRAPHRCTAAPAVAESLVGIEPLSGKIEGTSSTTPTQCSLEQKCRERCFIDLPLRRPPVPVDTHCLQKLFAGSRPLFRLAEFQIKKSVFIFSVHADRFMNACFIDSHHCDDSCTGGHSCLQKTVCGTCSHGWFTHS